MSEKFYFLVNDTQYDNHHGCLTVIHNLHAAMNSRGWTCCGALPVSSNASSLKKYQDALSKAALVIVNGEGSLHHDSRNANRLYDVCKQLILTKPIVLINALWQDNNIQKWRPLLEQFKAVYVRDKQSLELLSRASIEASYAPDLTFYDYARPMKKSASAQNYAISDSVINQWTEKALIYCAEQPNIDFITLFTGRIKHKRGSKDFWKAIKYKIYPFLYECFGISIPPRYRSLRYAIENTPDFVESLHTYRAICVARYHALCFVIQQEIPFVAIRSNSHKSEALLSEIDLPPTLFLATSENMSGVTEKLKYISEHYEEFRLKIIEFKYQANVSINAMFDEITRG